MFPQLLECAKYHLLQCATGESVLRLNKTQLASEAKQIQNTYMEEQYHETLLQYLQHVIPMAGDSSIFLQVACCLQYIYLFVFILLKRI